MHRATSLVAVLLLGFVVLLSPSTLDAATGVAPVVEKETSDASVEEQEDEGEQAGPPPLADPVGGFDLSILGATQFAVSNSGQAGVAFGYYFAPAARYGIEIEGGITFGPGGRLVHGLASLVLQAGARTSRYVPYVALGGGMVQAEVDPPTGVEDLEGFDIVLPSTSESAPVIAAGGGLRYYLREGISLRADYREFLVFIDDPDASRFSLRRIGGMLSIEF